jgi:hypothetical protein
MSHTKECCISDWVFLLSSYYEAGKTASELELLARAISARCRRWKMMLLDDEIDLVNKFVPENEKISKNN